MLNAEKFILKRICTQYTEVQISLIFLWAYSCTMVLPEIWKDTNILKIQKDTMGKLNLLHKIAHRILCIT